MNALVERFTKLAEQKDFDCEQFSIECQKTNKSFFSKKILEE